MCNYASAACRHLPQGGKKIRPNQEVHFQSRVWGEVDLTAAKVHQTIRALDPTGFQSQIIVEEVFFIPCLFVVHAPKIPQCSIHCLSGKIFHGNFLFLLPSQAKPLFGDCLFIYYSALAVSWPAPTLSCSSDPRVVAKHSLTFILSPPKNPRGLDPKEKMNFPILQQASPLDQVLAKVCKSLNEVVCLTFCSLIPFYTEIPAVNIEWKILEIWIAGFLFSKVAHVTQAAGLRHMNNFCISASFPHTYTNIPGILSHCLPEVEQRNIAR